MSFKIREMIQSHVRDFLKYQNKIISLEVVLLSRSYIPLIYIGFILIYTNLLVELLEYCLRESLNIKKKIHHYIHIIE